MCIFDVYALLLLVIGFIIDILSSVKIKIKITNETPLKSGVSSIDIKGSKRGKSFIITAQATPHARENFGQT